MSLNGSSNGRSPTRLRKVSERRDVLDRMSVWYFSYPLLAIMDDIYFFFYNEYILRYVNGDIHKAVSFSCSIHSRDLVAFFSVLTAACQTFQCFI